MTKLRQNRVIVLADWMSALDRDGHKFDLETQRFLFNRWQTETGRLVRDQLIDAIANSADLRAILEPHVLQHPDNTDSYSHPIYPKSEMTADRFWVLNSDDLRGLHLVNQNFETTTSLQNKLLSYCHFYNCNLSYAQLECCELSYARFKSCDLHSACMAQSGGFSTSILDCTLEEACLWDCGFIDADFMDSNFSGAYLEGAYLQDIQVNYRTQFDRILRDNWQHRKMPDSERPDILRAIRIAYQKAELWTSMDAFLYQEKKAQRKYIAWPLLQEHRDVSYLGRWLFSWFAACISGYSTKPMRVIVFAAATAMVFALLYFFAGSPSYGDLTGAAFFESLYFSFTTFATLGYGDVSYAADRPFLRIVSTLEAWMGAIFLSLYVVVLSRKALR